MMTAAQQELANPVCSAFTKQPTLKADLDRMHAFVADQLVRLPPFKPGHIVLLEHMYPADSHR